MCIIVVMAVTATSMMAQEKDFPKLAGSYLGQKPPGEVPVMFAPGIISVDEEYMLISHCDTHHGEVKFSISFKISDGSWSNKIKLPFYCRGFFRFQ